MFGFMLGSFLSKIYVDIGFVDLGMVEILFFNLNCSVKTVKEAGQTVMISRVTEGT